MEWMLVSALAYGGFALSHTEHQPNHVDDMIQVADARSPAFTRGEYIRSRNGYYITDLSKEPEEPKVPEGCVEKVLVSDLEAPLPEGESRPVLPVDVRCEEVL